MHSLLVLAVLLTAQPSLPPRSVLACLGSCASVPAHTQEVYTREPRSRLAFWTGLGLVATGTTLTVLSATTLRSSEPASPLAVPCGTDPFVAAGRPIAGCQVNGPILATGLSLAGGGAALMLYGGKTVEVIAAPDYASSSIAIRLRF